MSQVAALIGMVCACSIAVSALGIISPNGMTNKTLNLVIGVFIIAVMLVPIKNFVTDFNLNLPSPEIPDSISSDAHKAYNNAVVTETEIRLEKSLLSLLTGNGYSIKSVDVTLSENKDGGIYIKGINIYIIKTENQIQKIIRQTEEEFKVTPRVIVKE